MVCGLRVSPETALPSLSTYPVFRVRHEKGMVGIGNDNNHI
jgi:hypothetical protein